MKERRVATRNKTEGGEKTRPKPSYQSIRPAEAPKGWPYTQPAPHGSIQPASDTGKARHQFYQQVPVGDDRDCTDSSTHSLTHCGFNSLPPGCSFPRITSEHVRLQFHRLPLRPDQQPRFLLPSISYRETSLLKHRNGKPQEST